MAESKKPAKSSSGDKPKAKAPKPAIDEAPVANASTGEATGNRGSCSRGCSGLPLRQPKAEKKAAKAKKEAPAPVEPPKENLSLDPNDVEKPKIIKAKGSKNVHTGIAHVLSTFNNTIVTITDLKGNVIGWSSAGKVGFKGSRKSTAYAAQMVAQDASRQAMGHGLKEVEVLGVVRERGANPLSVLCRLSGSILPLFGMSRLFHITAVARRNSVASDRNRFLPQLYFLMGRYTGPKTKVSRRYGVPLFGPSKALERKNYPPGMHGPKGSRRKQSDYAIALGEKQKLRYQYGLLEKQFRRIFQNALRKRGVTGETLLQLLETRLDNVVFRLGLANTRSAARQLVSHGHVQVNGRKVNIASYNVKAGDEIT